MRKFLQTLISLLLITSTLSVAAAATGIKSGGACSKVGETAQSNGLKFTCVKAGRKLFWNNGVRTTYDPASSSTAIPTDFKNLFVNKTNLAQAAWTNISKSQAGKIVPLPPVEIYKGPNTILGVPSPIPALQYVANLFPHANFPKKIIIFYYSQADLNWGLNKSKEIMGESEYQAEIAAHGGPLIKCSRANDCSDGDAYIGTDGTNYIAIGEPNVVFNSPDYPFSTGGVEGCEFYHSLALMNYFHNNTSISTKDSIVSSNYPPQWMGASSENFVISAIQSKGDQKSFIRSFAQKNNLDHNFGEISQTTFSNYLDLKNLNNYWSNNTGHFFQEHSAIGNGLVEILVGLKGPEIMLEFFSQMSQGTTFIDAFKQIAGASWEDAEPEIEKTLYDKYLHNY